MFMTAFGNSAYRITALAKRIAWKIASIWFRFVDIAPKPTIDNIDIRYQSPISDVG